MTSLREWRARALLTQDQLAAKAGVSNKTLVGVERGHGTPTFRTIKRIADALGVDPMDVDELAAAIGKRAGNAGRE